MTIALPVRIVRIDGGFKILDARGKSIAYVYAAEGSRLAAMPDMLSFEEAEEVAKEIARGLTLNAKKPAAQDEGSGRG